MKQALMTYLEQAVRDEASDIFFVAGGTASEKVGGRIRSMGGERLLPPDTEALVTELYAMAGRSMEHYQEQGDDDFSLTLSGVARFRINAYRQRGSMAAVIRVVSFDIPNWEVWGIAPQVMDLADTDSGMILVTGTAGSGKSTTQACMIDRINRTRECHIVTLKIPSNSSIVTRKAL